jgi:hypothetical protein
MATDVNAEGASFPEIMICPASGAGAHENVERTVANGIPWSSLAPVIAPDTADGLLPLVDENGELRFWGFRENSRDHRDISPKPPQSWQRLVEGTLLLFIGRGRTTYTGVIGAVIFDPGLSEVLWDSSEFCWVAGLVDVIPLHAVSEEEVREAAGFLRVQMSMPVPPERRAAVQALLGVTQTELATGQISSLAQIDPDAPLSAWAIAERRNEQSLLRRTLIPHAAGTCDLCGETYPATFLRAAHVKQRAACSEDEKRDPTNVLVACVFCDVAFERGWITLDEGRHILVSTTLAATQALSDRLELLRGRIVERELNRASVAYHREHAFTP